MLNPDHFYIMSLHLLYFRPNLTQFNHTTLPPFPHTLRKRDAACGYQTTLCEVMFLKALWPKAELCPYLSLVALRPIQRKSKSNFLLGWVATLFMGYSLGNLTQLELFLHHRRQGQKGSQKIKKAR